MNIEDIGIEAPEVGQSQRLEMIFGRQMELLEKYHKIERANRLLQTESVPVGLHNSAGQARLKDFAWRITEELVEAIDAIHDGESHVHEELADTLHFLVEMLILSDIGPEDLTIGPLFCYGMDDLQNIFCQVQIEGPQPPMASQLELAMQFIKELGMACHTLKCKPWKQAQVLTDVKVYRERMIGTFHAFVRVCLSFNLHAQPLFNLYFKKSEVNSFRIRSKY